MSTGRIQPFPVKRRSKKTLAPVAPSYVPQRGEREGLTPGIEEKREAPPVP